jgi:hypothetical protein
MHCLLDRVQLLSGTLDFSLTSPESKWISVELHVVEVVDVQRFCLECGNIFRDLVDALWFCL